MLKVKLSPLAFAFLSGTDSVFCDCSHTFIISL